MKEKFNALYEFIKKTIHGDHTAEFYDTVLDCVCSYNRNQKAGSDSSIIAWLYYGYGICCDERDHAHKQEDDHLLKRFVSDLYLNLIEVPDALSRNELRRKYQDYDLANYMLDSLDQHVYAEKRRV